MRSDFECLGKISSHIYSVDICSLSCLLLQFIPFSKYNPTPPPVPSRNSNKLLKLPSIKLEFGKKVFRLQGARFFINLPLKMREIPNAADFKKILNGHFHKLIVRWCHFVLIEVCYVCENFLL